jgi:histidinol phosphatase-like PHP family hydrolase
VANPLIEVVAGATIVALREDGVALQLASGERRDLTAGSLVVAQGREPADELLAQLREAGVPCELIGDAHSVGRIGDAVHAGHAAVQKLTAGSSPNHSPGTIHEHPFRT